MTPDRCFGVRRCQPTVSLMLDAGAPIAFRCGEEMLPATTCVGDFSETVVRRRRSSTVDDDAVVVLTQFAMSEVAVKEL